MTSFHDSSPTPAPASTPTRSAPRKYGARRPIVADTAMMGGAKSGTCGGCGTDALLGTDDLCLACALAPRPTYAPAPATCQHTDRPAWPVSEAGKCHACHDLEFRVSAFLIGARSAGFDVTPDAAQTMMVNLNALVLMVPARVEVAS